MKDPIREKWEKEYPGKTDDGLELPIEKVIPGAIVRGIPVGYFSLLEGQNKETPWEFLWNYNNEQVW